MPSQACRLLILLLCLAVSTAFSPAPASANGFKRAAALALAHKLKNPIQRPAARIASRSASKTLLRTKNGWGKSLRLTDGPGREIVHKGRSAIVEWTQRGRIKAAELPTQGMMRYRPKSGYDPRNKLPSHGNGYRDKFENIWIDGPSRTKGENFEWDVQLSKWGRNQVGKFSRDGSHLNVSQKGRITHK